MNDERIQVTLDANINGFKAKMKEASGEAKNLAQQLKVFTKGAFVNDQYIDIFSNKISIASGKAKNIGNSFKLVRPAIQETTNEVEKLGDSFNKAKSKTRQTTGEINKLNSASKKIKNGVSDVGNSISKAFSKGLRSVKRLTLGFLGARSAFSLFRKYMSEYQNQNEEFANKMQTITSVITNALAPAFEFFANLLLKVTAIFARLMKIIFKVDVANRNVNKSISGTAKSAKQLVDNLTNLDEITNLQTDSGADGGGIGDSGLGDMSLPDVDTSKIEAAFEKIKRLGAKLFEPVKKAWDKVGKDLIKSAENAGKSMLGMFGAVAKSLVEVWTNGTGEKIVTNALTLWKNLFDIVGGVSEAIKGAWENSSSGTEIIQAIADIYEKIQELVLSITESIKNWVISENFQTALNTIFEILSDIFKIASDIVGWISDMYQKYLAPVVDKALTAIGSIIEMIGAIWTTVEPVVSQIVGIIKTVLEPAIQIVSSALGAIFDVLNGVAQFITGVFTLNWEKAWNGIKIIFEGVWNGIKGVFKGVVNLIISGINLLINGINKLVTPIRALIVGIGKVLGKNFTMDNIKIPTIPKLDVGTNYVPEDMLAVVHKGEAVVPKKFNEKEYFGSEETNALLMQLNSSVLELAKNPTQLYVNGKELAKATYSDYQEEGSRRGANTSIRRV